MNFKISCVHSSNNDILGVTSVVILAAGFSSRMGRDKALLKFDNDHNFIQKIVSTYHKAGIRDVLVVVNPDNSEPIKASFENQVAFPVKFETNPNPERGRFSSICEGIGWNLSGYNWFIQDCDNPFVTEAVIARLIEEFVYDHAMIPVYKGKKGHPVLLPGQICPIMMVVKNFKYDFKSFIEKTPVRLVEVDDSCILRNINTWDDYLSLYSKNNETT